MHPVGSGGLCKWNPFGTKLLPSGECPCVPPPGALLQRSWRLASAPPELPGTCSGQPPEKPSSRSTSHHIHECCGKHLKVKFPITAGISGVSCCWLQLSHGGPVTSSAGLTVLSSKAGLGPCHWGGGTCHFLLKPAVFSITASLPG